MSGHSLWADDVRPGSIPATTAGIFNTAYDLAGVDAVTAAEWAERFLDDMARDMRRGR